MSAATALARGRAAAERLMVDACLIRRGTGTTTDPDTGVITPTYATVYTGKCRVQQTAPNAREALVGEAELLMLPRQLQLPVTTSTGVRAGHLVTITASANDPDLVDREFVVRGEFAKSHATSRRLGIDERTS